jgi:HSP20 family molecular chaperone IbpA
MAKKRRSFFERLTGAISLDEDDLDIPEDDYAPAPRRAAAAEVPAYEPEPSRHAIDPRGSRGLSISAHEDEEGELGVDLIETPDSVILRAMVAGVRPSNLDIQISRQSVTIRGSREEESFSTSEDHIVRELYWGAFSRVIELPAEIDIEEAVAKEKNGLLTIVMPKVDKERKTKLSVKPE